MSASSKQPSRFLFYLFATSIFLSTLIAFSFTQLGIKIVIPISSFGNCIGNLTYMPSIAYVNQTHSEILSYSSKEATRKLSNRGDSSTSDCYRTEDERNSCDPNKATLKVFMYDLPSEFHFELLGWRRKKNQVWPNVVNTSHIPKYPGGLNLQHSVEYWLTIDLLSSTAGKVARPCTAIRVQNSLEANVIFVPFFSSLSYNKHSKIRENANATRDGILQEKLVQFLLVQKEWKRNGGKDHLIVAHHPNSLLYSRKNLASAMFVLGDFGRYPAEIANLRKDMIAPYRHVVKGVHLLESATFDRRPILAYFQGAIHRKDGGVIRQMLYRQLRDERDVHFAFGNIRKNGIEKAGQGMESSKFCLNIAGDTPSSNRLFDAIATLCVPVIISDEIELPFEDAIDYSEFCVFVRAAEAVQPGELLRRLRGIGELEWTKMWKKLKEIAPGFEYRYPSEAGDAVDMIWQALSRKLSSPHDPNVNRKRRYRHSQVPVTS